MPGPDLLGNALNGNAVPAAEVPGESSLWGVGSKKAGASNFATTFCENFRRCVTLRYMPSFRRKRPGLGVPDQGLPKTWDAHPSDDLLEEYSFGRLDEHDIARLEEHLMLCEKCRDSLEHVE